MVDNKYLLADETYNIIGAAMEVHKELGCGFVEKIYQEALEIEFRQRGIPFKREECMTMSYKGIPLKQAFYADFVCYDNVIVELKAVTQMTPEHHAQIINYLRCTNKRVGLLLNFGESSLVHKRFVI